MRAFSPTATPVLPGTYCIVTSAAVPPITATGIVCAVAAGMEDRAVGQRMVEFDDLALLATIVFGNDAATAEGQLLDEVVERLALVGRCSSLVRIAERRSCRRGAVDLRTFFRHSRRGAARTRRDRAS
jgi:hypothetical protein